MKDFLAARKFLWGLKSIQEKMTYEQLKTISFYSLINKANFIYDQLLQDDIQAQE